MATNIENFCLSNNLIYYIQKLKLEKYSCHYKFGNYYSNTPDYQIHKILFENHFPFIWKFITQFDKQIMESSNINDTSLNDNYDNLDQTIFTNITEYMQNINDDIYPIFGKEWDSLNFHKKGKTKTHIILVLIFTNMEIKNIKNTNNLTTNVNSFSNNDCNTLLWAALLHDIAKHVTLNTDIEEKFEPEDSSPDKTHPYKSGALTLKIFYSMQLIKPKTNLSNKAFAEKRNNLIETCVSNYSLYKEQIDLAVKEVYDLLIKSVEVGKIRDGKKIYTQTLDNMEEIISNMKFLKDNCEYGQFIYDVTVLVTFHQSVPNCTDHMNKPILNKELVNMLFDSRLLELMRILMVNDSAAHSLGSKPSFSEEINDNINLVSGWLN